MLAPQSGSDIEGQMGMIQDVLTQDVDAIILSTHDENAAAPLVKQAVGRGHRGDHRQLRHPQLPHPGQRRGRLQPAQGHPQGGMYATGKFGGAAKVGVLEGLPGYHSTERIGGFLDAFADFPGMEVVASLPTAWNVGNRQHGHDGPAAGPPGDQAGGRSQ